MPPCMTDFDDTLIELVPDTVVCTSFYTSFTFLCCQCEPSPCLDCLRVLTVYHLPSTIHHVVTRMSNASNAQHIARMIIVSNYHPTDSVVCTCMPMYAEKNQRRTSSKTQGPSTLAPIGPVWQYAKPSSHPPMLVHICNVSLDVSLGQPPQTHRGRRRRRRRRRRRGRGKGRGAEIP
jgi:hypothetical protein